LIPRDYCHDKISWRTYLQIKSSAFDVHFTNMNWDINGDLSRQYKIIQQREGALIGGSSSLSRGFQFARYKEWHGP
jgi:hypothetical protein